MVAHKRPHIERAALQLFVKRGLRGTTVRDIATRARVAEGTNRVAIHRGFGTLSRRLAEYQRELTDAVLASLEPRRRRRAPA